MTIYRIPIYRVSMTERTQTYDAGQLPAASQPASGRRRGALTAILLLAFAGVVVTLAIVYLPVLAILVGASGGCGGG